MSDLKAVCDSIIANPAYRPANGKTHCNAGALEAALEFDCHEFDVPEGAEPMMADEMYEVMEKNESGRWMKVDGDQFAANALNNRLGYAALPSYRLHEAHGHIATGYPASDKRGGVNGDGQLGMEWSGSLQKDVPYVANVGKTDCEEKVSQAFPPIDGEPDYFIFS
jgi:hypothetical protein